MAGGSYGGQYFTVLCILWCVMRDGGVRSTNHHSPCSHNARVFGDTIDTLAPLCCNLDQLSAIPFQGFVARCMSIVRATRAECVTRRLAGVLATDIAVNTAWCVMYDEGMRSTNHHSPSLVNHHLFLSKAVSLGACQP